MDEVRFRGRHSKLVEARACHFCWLGLGTGTGRKTRGDQVTGVTVTGTVLGFASIPRHTVCVPRYIHGYSRRISVVR